MSIATELTALSGHITNAYDAVQTKGGTIPANKNMANLDDAILSIQSGADITNGTIKQHKATSSSVPASTFFEFVDGDFASDGMSPGAEAQLSTVYESGEGVRAARLTSDSFFVIHRGTSFKLSGSVCSVNGNKITPGTETVIGTSSSAYIGGSLAVLGPSSVFVTYYRGSATINSTLHGRICSVAGSTITLGAEYQIGAIGTAQYVDSFPVDSSTVLVTHKVGTDLCGVLCSVVGEVITPITSEVVLVSFSADADFSAFAVTQTSDTSFFICYRPSGATTLYGKTVTISGTTITAGTAVQLANDGYANTRTVTATALSSSSVFVTYVPSSGSYIAGVVCSINGSTITTGTAVQLAAATFNQGHIAPAALSASAVFLAAANNSGKYQGILCDISGSSITVGNAVPLGNSTLNTNEECHAVCIGDRTVVALYEKSAAYLASIAVIPPYTIQASQTKINGVTIDDITTATAGDVWVFADDVIYNGDADIRRY